MTYDDYAQQWTEAEVEAAEGSYMKATLGHNNPLVDAENAKVARIVQGVANRITSVRIVEGRDPHLEVRTTQPRNRPDLTLTAQAMGHLFEAPVVRVAAPDPLTDGVKSYRQPKRNWAKESKV